MYLVKLLFEFHCGLLYGEAEPIDPYGRGYFVRFWDPIDKGWAMEFFDPADLELVGVLT